MCLETFEMQTED